MQIQAKAENFISHQSLLNQIQTNAGNGTEHGEKTTVLKKINLTITECYKNYQLSVVRDQKSTIDSNL